MIVQTTAKSWPIVNPLAAVAELRNEYFGMRHPRAAVNDQHILCSSTESGFCTGLTAEGRRQASSCALPGLTAAPSQKELVILHSPLPRAAEPALILKERFSGLRKVVCRAVPELADRGWGEHEGRPETEWNLIRQHDQDNPCSRNGRVEPMQQFIERVGATLLGIDANLTNSIVYLVTHADYLQVLEHLFSRRTSLQHYSLDVRMFAYAEIRPLRLADREPLKQFRGPSHISTD